MPGSFRGGSGRRDVLVGRREMRKSVEMAQTSGEKEYEVGVEFTGARARAVFDESGLKVEDLGEPTGKDGKYTVKDIRSAVS